MHTNLEDRAAIEVPPPSSNVDPCHMLKQPAAINAASLILLKAKALKALLSVAILVFQKLINKKDVTPINSQPRINTNQVPAQTNKTIDSLNICK